MARFVTQFKGNCQAQRRQDTDLRGNFHPVTDVNQLTRNQLL